MRQKYDVDDIEPDVASESLDRLALALGGEQLVMVLFNGVTAMLADQAWQSRQGALMAISVVGEGCAKVLTPTLDRVMSLIMPTCQDPEPRVRWAFCNTVGQMATDFGVLFHLLFCLLLRIHPLLFRVEGPLSVDPLKCGVSSLRPWFK